MPVGQLSFTEGLTRIFSQPDLEGIQDILLGAVHAADGEAQADEGKKVVRDVIAIIQRKYGKHIGLEYVAEKVFLSPTYLSFLFKRETGGNLLQYLTQYRLAKAAELLSETNMRVTDICENVGYARLSYFCMIFKNNYGVTPAVYREGKR